MKNTRFEPRAGEFHGDMTAWLRENAADNADDIRRLRRALRAAREQELTPRQREMLYMHFELAMSMTQIAGELGVDKSTVSRTIARAKGRLYRILRYTI
ncbi:MAG: sigma-70 region 4 domain-containing protein [Oscillospiraceae bacterium]|nr:sigma-70 region 4 domain-containing protein [Oscillospiraceae bacterium]